MKKIRGALVCNNMVYESVEEYFNWARTKPKKQLKEYSYEECFLYIRRRTVAYR